MAVRLDNEWYTEPVEVAREHEPLVEAIKLADEELAAELMVAHITGSLEVFFRRVYGARARRRHWRDCWADRMSADRHHVRVAVDVGGTFTDLVAYDEQSEELKVAKVLTNTNDRARGVLAALAESGIPPRSVTEFVHGTTAGTNAVLEGADADGAADDNPDFVMRSS